MLIVFGTRPTTISTFSHTWEGDPGPTQYTVMGRYFHIMWLALFPTKKFVVVREPNGKEYGIDPSDPKFQSLAASKGAKTGFGLRPWWGWLVLLGLFLAFKGVDYYFSRPTRYTSETADDLDRLNAEMEQEMEALKEQAAAEDDTTGRAAAVQASIDRAVSRVGTLKKGEILIVLFPGGENPYLVYQVESKKGDAFTLLESTYAYEDFEEVFTSVDGRNYESIKDYWEPEKVKRSKAQLLQMAKAGPDDVDPDLGILMQVMPEPAE